MLLFLSRVSWIWKLSLLSGVVWRMDGFTQKERLLLDQIRQTFDDLGPEAMQLMELIVTKSNASDDGSKQPAVKQNVPSLRAIERFFLRLTDSEVAYWRVHPVQPGDSIVPADLCATDDAFRNDYHVTPVHVFASLKRMATQWQKRYVDNFGRRTKALDWPFPTTICQANCFGWLFSEDLLHRLRLLDAVHDSSIGPKTAHKRPLSAKSPAKTKKKKNGNGVAVDDEPVSSSKGGGGDGPKRPREVYLYNYPRYIPRPPTEGAAQTIH